MDQTILRRISHRQGIKWIRQWNYDVNVNVLNLRDIRFTSHKYIEISETLTDRSRISQIFPQEDFCIYVDFPFNQLVILQKMFYFNKAIAEKIDNDLFTCTYLWLTQYYEHYYKYYLNIYKGDDYRVQNLLFVTNSTSFKSISNCKFDERIRLCNKTNYKVKDIWDESDFYILNKKLQIAFKISLYPVSILGLVTNFIVVFVILKKENSDLFKEYKQYSYLWMNSIFCMMISLIEILSWMTECFYPFEVFCPEIRKLVAVQFFKIIFKEFLVTVFRLMCNFTYVAFALNRIGLIGREHGKIVTFMCEVKIKKYFGVTLLISV